MTAVAERRARRLLRSTLKRRVTQWDHGGGSTSCPDLHIHWTRSVVDAVEVVRMINPVRAQHERLTTLGPFIAVSSLTCSWLAFLDLHANDRRLRSGAPELFGQIQATGIERIEAQGWAPVDALERRLFELGIRHAARQASGPPGIRLVPEPTGGYSNPDALLDMAAEVTARKAKQIQRFRALGGCRRWDLFIWVTKHAGDADVALTHHRLPTAAPELPDGIDGLWLGSDLFPRLLVRADERGWRLLST